jgi:hypothetical protein
MWFVLWPIRSHETQAPIEGDCNEVSGVDVERNLTNIREPVSTDSSDFRKSLVVVNPTAALRQHPWDEFEELECGIERLALASNATRRGQVESET